MRVRFPQAHIHLLELVMKIHLSIVAAILFLFNNSIIPAINNPLEQPNNKYGMHNGASRNMKTISLAAVLLALSAGAVLACTPSARMDANGDGKVTLA